jgi:hypothetical protein
MDAPDEIGYVIEVFRKLQNCLDAGNKERLVALTAAVRKESRAALLQALRNMHFSLGFDGGMEYTLMRGVRDCPSLVDDAITTIGAADDSEIDWEGLLKFLVSISFEKPKAKDRYAGHNVTVLPPAGPGTRKKSGQPRKPRPDKPEPKVPYPNQPRPEEPFPDRSEPLMKELKPDNPIKVVQGFLDEEVLNIDVENCPIRQGKLILALAGRLALRLGKSFGDSIQDALDFLEDSFVKPEKIDPDQLEILQRFKTAWETDTTSLVRVFLEG